MRRLIFGLLLLAAPVWAQQPDPVLQCQEVADQALRAGQFFAASADLRELHKRIMASPNPQQYQALESVLFLKDVESMQLCNIATEALGYANSLLVIARKYAPDSEYELTVRLVLAEHARRYGDPRGLAEQLEAIGQILPKFQQAPMARFYNFGRDTLQMSLDRLRDPDFPETAMRGRLHRSLGAFPAHAPISEWPPLAAHYYWEWVQAWMEAIDSDPTFCLEEAEGKGTTLDFRTGQEIARLEVVRSLRRQDKFAEAALVLQRAEKAVTELRSESDAAEAAFWATHPDPALQFHWADGDLARLELRVNQEHLRVMTFFARGSFTPELLQQAAGYMKAASAAQQRCCQSIPDMEDLTWDTLYFNYAVAAPGWEERGRRLLDSLVERYRKRQDRPALALALIRSAELYKEVGQVAAAIQTLQETVSLVEDYLREVAGTTAAARRIRDRYRAAYELLEKLLLESGKLEAAYEILSRLQQFDAHTSGAAQRVPALQALAGLQQRKAMLEQQEQSQPAADPNFQGMVQRNHAEFQTTVDRLRQEYPRLERTLSVRPANLVRAQASLPPGTCVLEYFPSDRQLYIFALTRQGLRVYSSPCAAAQLDAKVRDCRTALVNGSGAQERLSELYDILIAPAASELTGKTTLAFVPNGSLFYLPLQALGRTGSDGFYHPLVETLDCATLTKAADLETLAQAPPSARPQVLGLGNPDGSLPAAGQECQQVATLFPGSRSFVGPQATADRLHDIQAGYLHLATHGYLDARNPANSFLLLGQSQKLYLPDIYMMKLNGVRMVTLSACQTALGTRQPGAEVSSIAEAFQVAGSPTVVASLWRVGDEPTRRLMVEFYRGLARGAAPGRALREAQVAMLRDPQYSQPVFWAAFELLGDWR